MSRKPLWQVHIRIRMDSEHAMKITEILSVFFIGVMILSVIVVGGICAWGLFSTFFCWIIDQNAFTIAITFFFIGMFGFLGLCVVSDDD